MYIETESVLEHILVTHKQLETHVSTIKAQSFYQQVKYYIKDIYLK